MYRLRLRTQPVSFQKTTSASQTDPFCPCRQPQKTSCLWCVLSVPRLGLGASCMSPDAQVDHSPHPPCSQTCGRWLRSDHGSVVPRSHRRSGHASLWFGWWSQNYRHLMVCKSGMRNTTYYHRCTARLHPKSHKPRMAHD